MLTQFYANIRKGDEDNHVDSRVNGLNISFDRKVVNHQFGCKHKDSHPMSKFFSSGTWANQDHQFDSNDLKTFFKVPFSSGAQAKPSSLDTMHCIIFAITCDLLTPTFGHREEPNRMNLYLFYCVMKEIPIDFGFLMCKYILSCVNDTCRNIPFEKF